MAMVDLAHAISAGPDGIVLRLKVVPGASRSRLVGLLGGRLKVAVTAPPDKGRANDAIRVLLAGILSVPRQAVRVTLGHAQPLKTVAVSGIDTDLAVARLAAALG